MEYICQNPDCKAYNKPEYLNKEMYRYIDGELTGEHATCPYCGQKRKHHDENEAVPLSEKGATSILSFNSASTEDKREILRKRSHEHFQKEVKEKKDHLMNKAMTEMKNLGKK